MCFKDESNSSLFFGGPYLASLAQIEYVQLVQEGQHLIHLLKLMISDSLQQQQLPIKRARVQNAELRIFKKETSDFFSC